MIYLEDLYEESWGHKMQTIQEFYEGQDVFITGGTGFLGKVLIEKLARSCHGIKNIYVLMRPKKGMDVQQRLEAIYNTRLFDRIKKECPENMKKIVAVPGNCMELQLGLSASDRRMLEENVSIIFHSAASVRFDDSLTYATLMNTRGAREMMMLARNMKKLKALVHVSTCYCNCDRQEIDEILYPPHADWREIIKMVETLDEYTLNILTPKILNNLPNTYIFTKSMAEHVVNDLGENIPRAIFRPSIVVNTTEDPFVGWIDNFNGPVGLLVAGAKGVVKVSYGYHDTILDLIPVDLAIKIMIVSAWKVANSGSSSEPFICHGASGTKKRMTLEKIIEMGLKYCEQIPFENMIWKESGIVTNNIVRYYCRLIYTQLIPAVFLDSIIKLSGHQPLLMKLHRRIFQAQIALHYFVNNTWLFNNENLFELRKGIPECDKDEFGAEGIEYVDEEEIFRNFLIGSRTYLMKEDPATIPQAKVHRT
ncbi:hypothetical protein L9F63_009570, partial [Diploptera punctata]